MSIQQGGQAEQQQQQQQMREERSSFGRLRNLLLDDDVDQPQQPPLDGDAHARSAGDGDGDDGGEAVVVVLAHNPLLAIQRVRWFSDVRFALSRRQDAHRYIAVDRLTLEDPLVRLAIDQATDCDAASSSLTSSYPASSASSSSTPAPAATTSNNAQISRLRNENMRRASKILSNMASRLSTVLIRCVGWTLRKCLRALFSAVYVRVDQNDRLREAARAHPNAPILFLPSHKSHIDYLLVSYLAFDADISVPHIAAGDNLNIFFFGGLARRAGAFFIRRKLESVMRSGARQSNTNADRGSTADLLDQGSQDGTDPTWEVGLDESPMGSASRSRSASGPLLPWLLPSPVGSVVSLTGQLEVAAPSGEQQQQPSQQHANNTPPRRRSDSRATAATRDTVYRAVLRSYVRNLLRIGGHLEFFLEGGRSRSGKVAMPKYGLLSLVVDTFLDNEVDDVLVVPINVSYDQIVEGDYARELMGAPKQPESFFGTLRGLARTVMRSYGSLYVDVETPFLLTDFLRAATRPEQAQHLARTASVDSLHAGRPHDLVLTPAPASAFLGSSSSASSFPSSSNTSIVPVALADLRTTVLPALTRSRRREIVDELGRRVLHSVSNLATLTSTAMVALLFTTRFRKGASMSELTNGFNWLVAEASARGRAVGYIPGGDAEDAVVYACTLLGADLVDVNAEGLIVPTTSVPNIFTMCFYANQAASMFLIDAVVASVIHMHLKRELGLQNEQEDELPVLSQRRRSASVSGAVAAVKSNPSTPNRKRAASVSSLEYGFSISHDELIAGAQEVCSILAHEYIFHRPHETPLVELLNHAIAGLVKNDVLTLEETLRPDSPARYEVSLDPASMELVRFLRFTIKPVIDSYWMSACALLPLLQGEQTESAFVRNTQQLANEYLQAGVLECPETISREAIKNAIQLLESWGVVTVQVASDVRTLVLRERYQSRPALIAIAKSIAQFS
ncbi:glycerol-3-phosphate acyltransferase [Capsaspora owczarzaki ATCC 30864]|uniref:Glycerol-3-phosphate acyltransferase n=1 Tax=Capsaspora owczarzaki (strain ATCC 30864) TaxID=595528 RepID=A0A0D2WU63_CAPO3|nr:glycerol-3-phosphate acyltransferase [Capsaspora owczarzaki ATCC 30864]KJE96105.1 glycerol-3-phosphate acyltransferase [Capsaspora owczarzaki ATCC 30864]|eukprot:XP_004345223.2 glycerol-3-phosphate acyltransferase [Capsaspora owczarzaki ATCC 30864]